MIVPCIFLKKWLLPFSTGVLEARHPNAAAIIADHIATCSSCRDDVRRFAAADMSLRQHIRASRIAQRLDSPPKPRSASAMTNRVMAVIQPEEKYTASVTWTPSTVSFVGVAAFAVVAFTFLNPQSGARAWFANSFLGHNASQPSIVQPAKPPFSDSHDPFSGTVAPQLKGALAGQPSGEGVIGPTERPSMTTTMRKDDMLPDDSARGGSPSANGTSHSSVLAEPSAPDSGFAENSASAIRESRLSVPPVSMEPMKPSVAQQQQLPPAAPTPLADASEPRYLAMDKDGAAIQPPSPPGALTGQPNLLQSDLPVAADGPIEKRSLLQTLTADSKVKPVRKDNCTVVPASPQVPSISPSPSTGATVAR